MLNNPLGQFEIKKLVSLNALGIDISFTNSSLYMLLATSISLAYLFFATRPKALIPSRLQMSAEILYNLITGLIDKNIGENGHKFSSLIFSLFLFILLSNFLGLLPYSFTVTSHISITFLLAAMVFCIITIVGFVKQGRHFLQIFLPRGIPLWLAPLMIIIELFAYLARPVSLSLRLASNMVAGHILLKVIAGFIVTLVFFLKFLPVPLIIILIGFEFFVSILQAYIFAILACVYLSDAVNSH